MPLFTRSFSRIFSPGIQKTRIFGKVRLEDTSFGSVRGKNYIIAIAWACIKFAIITYTFRKIFMKNILPSRGIYLSRNLNARTTVSNLGNFFLPNHFVSHHSSVFWMYTMPQVLYHAKYIESINEPTFSFIEILLKFLLLEYWIPYSTLFKFLNWLLICIFDTNR